MFSTWLWLAMFLILLGIYLGVELLNHMAGLWLAFSRTVFPSDCTRLYSQQQCMQHPVFLHPYQHLFLSVFKILAILVVVK
jgi:hypothetical protein